MCSCSVFLFFVGVVMCALVLDVSSSQPMKEVQFLSVQYFKDKEASQDVTPIPKLVTNSSVEPNQVADDQDSTDDHQMDGIKLKDIASRLPRLRRSLNASDLQLRRKASCREWGQPQILPTPC
ncbi:uncharacterized protein LOC124362078 [Homalodisca vitripennis]|uniref:uncharacterized protein LOC124362078 n=1 Tax=Homalodisca vitripennis TaxID=197043 RepID=UPI001EECC049|nr:uncharacterized protein LOC124362078 [Homalodisca vitripennis]XP_046672207.1 uncharacterized protein LOC124362078 [Homalodisca vitripennis]KAG8251249.1 hypothetical protein J6590_083582 [Homalodisca vitripennis]